MKTKIDRDINLIISGVIKRISELEDEYYNLEIIWRKNKTFIKLDRKHDIEKVFRELNISLKNWN